MAEWVGGQQWLAVASYVRAALRPQLPALVSRFAALDVRHRGVCVGGKGG